MTAGALGEKRPTLFLRNATGLVRGWSVRDSMIYACLSTNVVTLGMVEWAFQSSFPQGNLLYSILISGVWVSFLVIAYTGLVVTIPRAGGDYVWQSRILGSGLGFVMAATGWWFIMWLWAPIYGTVLSEEFFQPLWATTGHAGAAAWFATHNGIFVVTLITIVLAGVLVSIGMAGYARVQKWCFYGGLVGFAIIVIILLITSKASFISSFNMRASQLVGLWTTVLLSVVFLLLFAKTFGWSFYLNINQQWSGAGKAALPIFPYPMMLASWVVHNAVFQFILILIMSLWFFGWVGTLFLSSTRVIFAAAFDRVLPNAAAQVSEKRRVPFPSLVLMLLPAVGLGALYAYNTTFAQYTLDGVLVTAVTYLG